VDLDSFALSNRLVGNPETATAFETSGGLEFSVDAPTMVVVTGAISQVSVLGGPPLGWGSPVVMPSGATIRVTRLLDGARAYIAVRGGLVGVGDELVTGRDPTTSAAEHAAPRRPPATEIRLWPGPRIDWFTEDARRALTSEEFVVTTTSHVGTRLSGPALTRVRDEELASEGLVEGALQVPPDGQPIVMLSGHPATGGYPVIAVVDPADIGAVAQAAPGIALRFSFVSSPDRRVLGGPMT
jgi:allophanate hydrolase subunit 2